MYSNTLSRSISVSCIKNPRYSLALGCIAGTERSSPEVIKKIAYAVLDLNENIIVIFGNIYHASV